MAVKSTHVGLERLITMSEKKSKDLDVKVVDRKTGKEDKAKTAGLKERNMIDRLTRASESDGVGPISQALRRQVNNAIRFLADATGHEDRAIAMKQARNIVDKLKELGKNPRYPEEPKKPPRRLSFRPFDKPKKKFNKKLQEYREKQVEPMKSGGKVYARGSRKAKYNG